MCFFWGVFSQLIQFSRFLEKFEVRMFEDTKGVIRSRKSKDGQCNDQQNTNKDLQNTTQKTKDLATRTPHKWDLEG